MNVCTILFTYLVNVEMFSLDQSGEPNNWPTGRQKNEEEEEEEEEEYKLIQFTLCPSGTWPLMTDRMSWRVIPLTSPSRKPITSHSTSAVGSSPFWLWMLKDCSWHKQDNDIVTKAVMSLEVINEILHCSLKASYNFFHICSSTPQDLCPDLEL